MNEYQKQWWDKNRYRLKQYRKTADLKKKYGITLEKYNEMLVEQSAVCYICRQPETQLDHRTKLPYSLSVDHCHKTGDVRRLLCNRCNRTLGMVDDNSDLLEKMIMYINEFKLKERK